MKHCWNGECNVQWEANAKLDPMYTALHWRTIGQWQWFEKLNLDNWLHWEGLIGKCVDSALDIVQWGHYALVHWTLCIVHWALVIGCHGIDVHCGCGIGHWVQWH
jgi:hypothetical protein